MTAKQLQQGDFFSMLPEFEHYEKEEEYIPRRVLDPAAETFSTSAPTPYTLNDDAKNTKRKRNEEGGSPKASGKRKKKEEDITIDSSGASSSPTYDVTSNVQKPTIKKSSKMASMMQKESEGEEDEGQGLEKEKNYGIQCQKYEMIRKRYHQLCHDFQHLRQRYDRERSLLDKKHVGSCHCIKEKRAGGGGGGGRTNSSKEIELSDKECVKIVVIST